MAHTRHAHGPLVRALREAHRLTLADLARDTGLSVGYLSRIEGGTRRAPWETTVKLGISLGIDPAQLTGQRPPLRPLRHLVIGSDPQATADYAESLGLSIEQLYAIELGWVSPTPEQLDLFAQRLGVPLAALTVPAPEQAASP